MQDYRIIRIMGKVFLLKSFQCRLKAGAIHLGFHNTACQSQIPLGGVIKSQIGVISGFIDIQAVALHVGILQRWHRKRRLFG